MSRGATKTAAQVAGVVGVLLVLFAWNEGFFRDRIRAEDDAGAEAEVFSGASATVERRLVPTRIEVAGTVRAQRSASLSARVPGVIEEITVEEGARVAAGDLVVRLTAPDLDSRGDAARGAVAAARAAVTQAERDFRRIAALHDRAAATRLEREQAETRLREARGALARALGESQATSTVADYAKLRVPFDGVVARRWLDPGDLASPGVPILTVIDDSELIVEADVAESVAARLEVGGPVEVGIDALDDARPGRIREILPAADPATRTTRVKISLADRAGLRAGLFARVRLPVGAREALVVPARALRRAGELTLVDTIAPGGVIEPRHVELGRVVDEASIEVTAGLAAGERVALDR